MPTFLNAAPAVVDNFNKPTTKWPFIGPQQQAQLPKTRLLASEHLNKTDRQMTLLISEGTRGNSLNCSSILEFYSTFEASRQAVTCNLFALRKYIFQEMLVDTFCHISANSEVQFVGLTFRICHMSDVGAHCSLGWSNI